MSERLKLLPVIALALLAGCNSAGAPPGPVALGCGPGIDVTDAAACWIWNDSVERSKPGGGDAQRTKPLLRGTGQSTIIP